MNTSLSSNQYWLILTQYLQVPTSTAHFWPSSTNYKPVFERILTGRSLLINLMSYLFHQGSCLTRATCHFLLINKGSSYIKEYWPILNLYHQVPTSTDHLLLAQYYRLPSSTALYWPITTKYHPALPSTDLLPLSTNHYRPILTQYHQEPSYKTI